MQHPTSIPQPHSARPAQRVRSTLLSGIILVGLITPGSSSAQMEPAAPAPLALAPLPDPHGFAGMFAGVAGGALLCAGGANFPERPFTQGGAKVWHDRVFILSAPDGLWREAGRLPRVSGYGVSATWRDAVVLAGGGDARSNFSDAFLMRWDGTRLSFEGLPPLPVTTANSCGAVVGDTLYVAGGQESPAATGALSRCFALDLSAATATREWREIPWPATAPGRILAVAAAHNGWFYLFSGADLHPDASGRAERRYLTDAWRFQPAAGWQRLADLPHAVAAAPSPAMNGGDARLVVVGGVSPEFLATLPPNAPHPGFPRELLTYDIAANRWIFSPQAITPAAGTPPPRVTAPLVAWKNLFVVPSGELSPGLRTPTVLAFRFPP